MKSLNYIKIYLFVVIAFSVSACNDEFKDDLVKDNKPEIPVTFDGATTSGFNPYYSVAYNGGAGTFSITLTIPENSPVKIKEVSKIIAGTTAVNAGSLSGIAGLYFATAVSVDDYSYTLTSSINEFNSKFAPLSTTRVSVAPAAGAVAERAFMFQLIMEDDSVIIPVQVRIRVTP